MHQPKSKLLILVDWFVPGFKAGGPIRSAVNIAYALQSHYQVKVFTTDTDHGETQPYPNIVANQWRCFDDTDIEVYYARKSTLSLRQMKREIAAINPDYIYLNHIWSPKFVLLPLMLKMVSSIKGKIVLCPRGGLYETAISVKRYKKVPLLMLMKLFKVGKFITFHATNEQEKRAILKYFPGSDVKIADNLPTCKVDAFSPLLKEKGILKCVNVARILDIKNLAHLLNACKYVKGKLELTIVGPDEDKNYWNRCKEIMETLPANISVNYVGSKTNEEIQQILQANHLFVLPTRGENFGHSIFESFLAGRPVLISDQTPWRQLEKQHIGWDISLDNVQSFSMKLDEAVEWSQEEFDVKAKAARCFAKNFIAESDQIPRYLELFSQAE